MHSLFLGRVRSGQSLKFKKLLHVFDHFRVLLSHRLHECGGLRPGTRQHVTHDCSADNWYIMRRLTPQRRNPVFGFPALPFTQVLNGEIGDVVLIEQRINCFGACLLLENVRTETRGRNEWPAGPRTAT